MVGAVVAAGVGLAEAWLACALGVVRRWSAPWLEPIVRRIGAPVSRRVAERPREASGPQVAVEEAKYWLGPNLVSATPDQVDRETSDLPRAYGHDHLVLLPRDPWWIFAYWEVTPTTRVRALGALGAEAESAREVLRVHEVTSLTFTGDNAWCSFDIELPPGAENWHVNVGRPAASFCAEIGLRTGGGRFLPLARSNTVTTPRSSPSPDRSVRWTDARRPDAPAETAPATSPPLATPIDTAEYRPGPADNRARSSEIHAPRAR